MHINKPSATQTDRFEPQNYRQSNEKWGVSGVNPKGGMLLFRALVGARNEGRQSQKMKKF